MAAMNLDPIIDKVLKIDDEDSLDTVNFAVFVDESIGGELREKARHLLVPNTDDVKIHVESFFDEPAVVDERADLTLIIANASPWAGATYAISKAKGIPTVVMAERLDMVIYHSENTGFEIDHDDIVSTEILSVSAFPAKDAVIDVITEGIEAAEKAIDTAIKVPARFFGIGSAEGFEMPKIGSNKHEPDYDDLFEEFGAWVIEHCPMLRAVFVEAYDFTLAGEVDHIVRKTAFQNAVTGAIFFVPGADFPIMTLNQLKMLVQVERAYGFGIGKETIPEAITVVTGAVFSRFIARRLCDSFPFFSWVIKIAMGYIATRIMGYSLARYCDADRQLPEPISQIPAQVAKIPAIARFVSKGPGQITQVEA